MNVNRLPKTIALLLLLLLVVASGSACIVSTESQAAESTASEASEDEAKKNDKADEEEAIPIEAATIGRGAIESILRVSSNLEAESAVAVFSQSAGLVESLRVEEGDVVEAGHVLLQLEDDEQRSELRKAKSLLAKQKREMKRQKQLFEDKLISEQAWNDAIYQLEQNEIAVEDAQRRLDYTTVRAPIGGTITKRLIAQGDRVQNGAQLFDMVDFRSLVARVYVPEKQLARLAVGQSARLAAPARADNAYRGRVLRVAPMVDGQSGTVKVTVKVGAQPGLMPGMYVDVELVTAQLDDTVLLPKRALVYDRDQTFVYRLSGEDRVERVYIEAELSDRLNVKPRGELAEGDVVVIAGQASLKPGALVEVLATDGVKAPPKDNESEDAEADQADATERASR